MNKSKGKPKTLSEWSEFFRNLPDTLRPKTQFENQKEPEQAPYRPTEFFLRTAGKNIHRLLRTGYFKDDKQELQNAFQKDGHISLWKEMVMNLRARANLAYPTDYLETFAEDCQLVADAIEKENKEIETLQKPPLSEVAGKIYLKLKNLPEHEAMNGKKILDWLAGKRIFLDESVLYGRILKELKPYGLQGKKRIGYYIRD